MYSPPAAQNCLILAAALVVRHTWVLTVILGGTEAAIFTHFQSPQYHPIPPSSRVPTKRPNPSVAKVHLLVLSSLTPALRGSAQSARWYLPYAHKVNPTDGTAARSRIRPTMGAEVRSAVQKVSNRKLMAVMAVGRMLARWRV